MKDFLLHHILILIGAAFLLIFPKEMSAFGFLVILCFFCGAWIAVLIINAVTAVLYTTGSDKNNKLLLIASLVLSFAGGAAGVYLAKLFGYSDDFSEHENTALNYALEFNIFVLAVLPLFCVITE